MKLGIVGLPNVGKSTLFNAILQQRAASANYPFSTIAPNVGVVPVPDARLAVLREMYRAKALVPATVEMVDIAGLVQGASKGEGLGNQFLSHIREVDALVHVVRAFADENVPHAYADLDPARDIETVNFELILADLELIERRLSKTGRAKNEPAYANEGEALRALQAALSEGRCARHVSWENAEDARFAQGLPLLTNKPVLYALNLPEAALSGETSPHQAAVEAIAAAEGSRAFALCAKIEEEMTGLPPEDRALFLEELGLQQGGLGQLIEAGYALLGLISFLTAGPKEVRAWTIRRGLSAQKAAGKIHSDLERGFIRAEVVPYTDLARLGSYTRAKENGLVRIEGKDYIVQDGDVVLVRFNV